MIALVFALAIHLQSAGEAVLAITPDDPETWVIEYPVVISPYVDDYYNCLKSGGHVVDGNTFFEEQHRRDIPRCSELKADGVEQVTMTFDTIDFIHVARARDLDGHLRMGVRTKRFYDELEAKAAEDAEL